MRELRVLRPGRLAYAPACAWQEEMVTQRRAGEIPDTLVLLEHDPVVTVGRSTPSGVPCASGGELPGGLQVLETSRGGQATYHGPGQLVGYPILDLRGLRCDLHWYMRRLEQVLIAALADLGLQAGTMPEHTGVWIGDRKVASIGVAVRGWVTYHGFALNVDCDMAGFSAISPCGLRREDMTRLRDLGVRVGVSEVMPAVECAFRATFGYE